MTKPLPLHRRREIEAEIETHLTRVELLVAKLDRVDAPLEDLEDDDPGGTDLDRGEAADDEGLGVLRDRPFYALDQASGPINYRTASNDHQCRENGMVRGRDGKWRWPVIGGGRG